MDPDVGPLNRLRSSPLVGLTGFGALRAALVAGGAVVATWLLGPHDRGLMVLGVTFGSVAALLVGMGTGSALRSRIPGADAVGRQLLVASFAWWTVLSAGAAGVLAVLLCALSAPLIGPELAGPALLVGVFVNAAGQVALTQLPDAWYAGGRFRAGSGWAALVALAGALGVVGAAALDRTAWALLLGQGLLMAVAGGWQAVRLRAAGLFALPSLPWRRLVELPGAGVRALGMTLGLVVVMRLDRYVLGAVAGPADVAVYSLAVTISGLPALVPAAMGQLALREVAAGRGLDFVRRAAWRAVRWAAAFSVPVAVAGWVLVVPVFGPEFAPVRFLLPALLGAGVILAPFEVASRGLLGGGWMGTAGLLGAAGCVLAVLAYTSLVSLLGLAGAALACCVLYAALSVGAWTLLRWRLVRRAAEQPENSINMLKITVKG
ncbi:MULTISPECIES: lipopolysaccharide biosynthesis protein [unclassified Plantactinospora]|uniref:lipopolysaccharide biosynthesis protein n=1 Tax=unclassified Plantactinospora TaxID=2631981 RepID=UPI00131F31DE|nr:MULTISPECIES: oligosaccharide flippase family protein [unclassified Plantactinospora]